MARSKWISFRAQEQLDRAAAKATNTDAKKFGLENFGNTCYANSVLQALYFCTPFRDLLLQDAEPVHHQQDSSSSPVTATPNKSAPPPLTPLRRKPERQPSISGSSFEVVNGNSPQVVYPIPASPPTLFSALRSLFLHISSNPGDKGTVAPRAFIDKLKELNANFRSTMHQDAHEFLNFLLNRVVEEIEEDKKQTQNGVSGDDLSGSVATLSSKTTPTTSTNSNPGTRRQDATLVHNLFEGVLTSETRCLTCETVSSRDESFLDLSIDIEQNSSVTACLRQFSASEMLCQKNKFFCDSCCDLQEAEKRMKIKKLPNVLALHLKRFKYQEDVAKYIKLAYRVAFPHELRLFNTVDDMDDADRLYNLFAIVVHVGNGPHHGHYISIIKTAGTWFVFDDDNVFQIPETDIPKYFGDSNFGSAYVLYYQAVDIDLVSLGLRPLEPPPETNPDVMPLPQQSTALQTLAPVPALPPGLNIFSPSSSDSDADHNHLRPPTTPSPVSLPHSEPEEAIPSISIPQSRDIPTASPAVTSSPITSGLGTKLINSIRRAPSMSVARGNTHVPIGGESSQEQPPPLPPLPASILNHSNSPPNVPPILNIQVADSKKEKEKDKTKSTGGWFNKKRKSLRIAEKSRSVPDPSPSPAIQGDERHGSHTPRFMWTGNHAPPLSMSSSSNSADVPTDLIGHRSDALRSESSEHDHRLNGYRRNTPPELSSSPGSSSHMTDIPSSTTIRPSHPWSQSSALLSGSDTDSGAQLDFSPSKNPSFASSSGRYPLVGRKLSSNLKPLSSFSASRPMTAPSSPTYMTYIPPLPPTPNINSQRTNVSLGDVQTLSTEPQDTVEGKANADHSLTSDKPTTMPIFELPTSMAASVGRNSSVGSTSSATSNIRLATRKLSLGFGKRDKEKDRERDRVSPSAFNKF